MVTEASLTFVGTATTVLRLGPFTVLTDPNFLRKGQLAYLGKGLVSRRRTEPAMPVGQLPPYDVVLLSHLHGDHFDRVARKGLDRSVPIVSTRHAARRLSPRGLRTIGLPTWDEHVLERQGYRLTITALPGVHAYGVMGALLPPVMGSWLRLEREDRQLLTLYISGDTLLGDHLERIHDRFGSPDAAVVHLGGTKVLGALVTLDAEGGVRLLDRIAPAAVVPVHYDDYGVFKSPLQDFLDAFGRSSTKRSTQLRTVGRGDTVPLGAPPTGV